MKTLVIVRHGTCNRNKPGEPDAAHPLDHRGRHQVAEAVDHFMGLGIEPDLVLTSPAKRACETTGIFQKKMKLPSEHLRTGPDIYEAEKREILRIVHQQNDACNIIMLVGHNPGMVSLLHHLVDEKGAERLPTAAFAVVELDVESWHHVSFKTSKLLHYWTPRVKEPHDNWWRRFTFWRRQRMQKVELFVIFLVGLLLILGVIALVVSSSTDSAGMPQQGSMGRNYE